MFIGHFAVGFAGKKLVPEASLPALLFAGLFADALWPVLVAVGAEHVRITPGRNRLHAARVRQLSVVAQPVDADHLGRPSWRFLQKQEGRRENLVGCRSAGCQPLVSRLHHAQARHAPLPWG